MTVERRPKTAPPRPASQSDTAEPPAISLGDLAQSGINILCRCHRCGHRAVLASALLQERLGPAHPVPDIARHLRCTGCGAKDVAVRPDWPDRPASGMGVRENVSNRN